MTNERLRTKILQTKTKEKTLFHLLILKYHKSIPTFLNKLFAIHSRIHNKLSATPFSFFQLFPDLRYSNISPYSTHFQKTLISRYLKYHKSIPTLARILNKLLTIPFLVSYFAPHSISSSQFSIPPLSRPPFF